MKENFFTKKMAQKSDVELQEIVNNKDSYIDDARLAASWELEKRNIKVDNLKIDDEVSQEKAEISTSKQSDPISADVINDPDENEFTAKTQDQKVALYSKRAIYGFSIFFSTIFGAAILIYNLKVIDQSKARLNVLLFAVLYMIFSVLIIEATQGSTFTALILNISGGFILNEYYWNKYIGKTFKYEPKGLLQAISIAILVVVVVFVILMLTMPAQLPA